MPEQTVSDPEQALNRETVVWGFAWARLDIWEPDELPEAEGMPEGDRVIEGINVDVIVEMRFVDDNAVEEG